MHDNEALSSQVQCLKVETSELSDELLTIKGQLRLPVAHCSTLIQEVSSLRNQEARQSTSSHIPVPQLSSKTLLDFR